MSVSLSIRQDAIRRRGEAVCHYCLIYLMIACADSFLYDLFLMNAAIPIVGLFLMIILLNRKYQFVYPLSILALALISMLFVRANTGAMGPTELISWVMMVVVTVVTVLYDINHFLVRFIKIASFLAAFSLVMYLLSQVVPGIWQVLTPFSFTLTLGDETYYDTYVKIVDYYKASGLILYIDRGFEADRNVSIFREPAVFQIMLNSIIFLLLFMCPKEIKAKSRKLLIGLLLVSILSTKSATGYATTLLIFFAYAVNSIQNDDNISLLIPIALGVACVAMFVFSSVGNTGLAANSVLGRFFDGGNIRLDGSGQARVGAANVAISLMQQHPFGCGYDVYGAELLNGDGLVGACLFKVAAVYGSLFGVAIIVWVCYPVFKSRELGLAAKVTFLLMYLIATYLENEVFYTTIIFIPIYLYCNKVVGAADSPSSADALSSGVLHEVN